MRVGRFLPLITLDASSVKTTPSRPARVRTLSALFTSPLRASALSTPLPSPADATGWASCSPRAPAGAGSPLSWASASTRRGSYWPRAATVTGRGWRGERAGQGLDGSRQSAGTIPGPERRAAADPRRADRRNPRRAVVARAGALVGSEVVRVSDLDRFDHDELVPVDVPTQR